MTMGPVKQTTSAELKVGVGANGKADLVIDPRQGAAVEIQGEVFVGAELILEQKTQFGDSAEVGGGVDIKAGIGAELKGDPEIGYDNISVDLSIGATPSLGADFNVDVAISPAGVVDDAGDIFNGAKGGFGSLFG